jgi:hypothetical protein
VAPVARHCSARHHLVRTGVPTGAPLLAEYGRIAAGVAGGLLDDRTRLIKLGAPRRSESASHRADHLCRSFPVRGERLRPRQGGDVGPHLVHLVFRAMRATVAVVSHNVSVAG